MAENRNPGALGATGAVSRLGMGPDTAHLAHRHIARQKPAAARAQETSDACAEIISLPAPGWRVIVCRDGLQWILQRRKKGGAERPWRAVGYCRTRSALLRLCATSCGALDPKAASTLAALPELFGNGGRT